MTTTTRKPLNIAVRVEPASAGFDDRIERIATPLRRLDAAQVAQRFALPAAAQLLKTTISLCPDCLSHVPAAVYVDAGRVLLNKHCPQHGPSTALLENDERYYRLSNKDRWGRCYAPERVEELPLFDGGSCCGPGETCGPTVASPWPHDFADQRSNKSCTVLLEVTDACNLACRVCYADARGDRIVPFERFQQTLRELVALKGSLDSVQLTGGEAALHPQFWDMLDCLLAEPGVHKIYLPTNGLEFAKPGAAERLLAYRAKLLVLLQFDGQDAANRTIRQAKPARLRSDLLATLARLDIPTQLTMTLAHDVNEQDIAWVVERGLRHANVRLVALQPVTYSGRYELPPDALRRLTLSDMVKGIVAGLGGKTREADFLPIPCSHPNCGWVTLFARRFGFILNIARHVDLDAVMNKVAYKTQLNQTDIQGIVGTRRGAWLAGLAARLGRRLLRPRDVLGIAIKPFMDRYNYDLDRVSACCHHIVDTHGRVASFCEYNARLRQNDSWAERPKLEREG